MNKLILGLIIAVEIFALANRGGGPLLSYLFLTGAVFLAAAIAFILRKKKDGVKFGAIEVSYIVFLAFFIISLYFAPIKEYSLAELLLFFNTGILLLILANRRFSEAQLKFFQIAVISLAALDTLIGFFIYANFPFPRLVGTFIDFKKPFETFGNDYANFILIVLPVALSMLFYRYSRFTTTWLYVLASAILFSGFLLSFSRAAWMSFFIIILLAGIWFFAHRKRKVFEDKKWATKSRIILRFASAAIIAVLLVAGLQFVRSPKFDTTSFFKKATFQADEGAASASERWEFWQGAAMVIKDHPLFGAGVYSFKFLFPQYQKTVGINWGQPHNLFLKLGVENGILAVLAFAAFLVSAAIACLRFLWRNPGHPILWLLLGSLAAFGHNLLDYNFITANFTLFMVFVGIALSFASETVKRAIVIPAKLAFSLLLLVSFSLLLLGFHEGFYNIDFKKGRELLAAGELDGAVKRLGSAQNLYFKRDLPRYLSSVYRQQYDKTRDPQWREKETTLLAGVLSSSRDASLFSRTGEIYMNKGEYAVAEYYFYKSAQLDPMNELKYFYQLVDSQRKQGRTIGIGMRRKILALLREYATALKQNRHLTILTENPAYAGRLYDFFGMSRQKQTINRLWFMEILKFSAKYGADALKGRPPD